MTRLIRFMFFERNEHEIGFVGKKFQIQFVDFTRFLLPVQYSTRVNTSNRRPVLLRLLCRSIKRLEVETLFFFSLRVTTFACGLLDESQTVLAISGHKVKDTRARDRRDNDTRARGFVRKVSALISYE